MEWSLMNPIPLVTDFGFFVSGVYVVSDDCEESLIELLDMLASDTSEGSERKKIWEQNLIMKNLVPLIIALEEESPLTELAIKLLALLTQPFDMMKGPRPTGSQAQREKIINGLLQQAGRACWNTEFLQKIKREILYRINQDTFCTLNPKESETVNYCLLLIRNLFYYTERDSDQFQKHQRLLFECRIDQMLLSVLRHPQKILFIVAVVQVLPFLFRGQEQLLCKSISSMCDTPVFLEHYESQQVQEDLEIKREMIDSIMDTMELNKPNGGERLHQDMEETGGQSDHIDDDTLGFCLLRFLKQFLSESFTGFIGDLLKITITSDPKIFDNLYLIWSLSFFLRFGSDLGCHTPELLQSLDINLISYLVYVMYENIEKLQTLQQQNKTCNQTQRKLHLTLLSLLNLFRMMTVAQESDDLLSVVSHDLQASLASMSDLREMFVVLLRHHQVDKQGMAYLKDVIITNHLLLLLMEKWGANKLPGEDFSMLKHVKKFASVDIMGKYGDALQNFDKNNNLLNDSILTLMHHVAGDCGQPRCLMQLSIMRTFTEIWDQKHLLSQDFNDLIEFVIEGFIGMAEKDPMLSAQMLFGSVMDTETDSERTMEEESQKESKQEGESKEEQKPEEMSAWSAEEKETLMTSILNLEESINIPGDLKHALQCYGFQRTEAEIESFIFEMGWLPATQSMVVDKPAVSEEDQRKMEIVEELSQVPQQKLVQYLVDKLQSLNHQEHVQWLQDTLVLSAEAKHYYMNNTLDKIREPVRKIAALLKKDIPIVMVTEEQENISRNIYFFALLNELQLKAPMAEEKQMYWRVPFEWSPFEIIEKAEQLGPLTQDLCVMLSPEDQLAYRFNTATMLEPDTDCGEGEISKANETSLPGSEWMNCINEANKLQQQQMVNLAGNKCQ